MSKTSIISIDGSAGEGGGQVLRTSLALSIVTGQPFRIFNIRAGRKKPGLLRQHLTAVQAATEIGDAVTDGATIGSGELVFRPERNRPGEYRFAIGTAGSTTLVLQTILPALMVADAPSRVVLEGGTHNPLAPSFDFFTRTFLPQLARFGPQIEATLVRPGFYPAGGGRIEVQITPCARLQPIELLERGADSGRRVVIHLAGITPKITERAFEQIERRLRWPREAYEVVKHPDKHGPGLAITSEVASAEITEIFSGFGERGIRIEQVANDMIDEIRRYLASTAPVGEYLADQLLIPLALARWGAFRTTGISPHTRTNIDVIRQFVATKLEIANGENGDATIRVASQFTS